MLPFMCGARNARYIRSTLKFSAKLSKSAGKVHQVKHARTISVLGVADKQCSSNKIQEILNKNDVRAFSIPAYNLSAACNSVLLVSDGGATSLLAVGASDDDEVTTSAGKKRKHWIKPNLKG